MALTELKGQNTGTTKVRIERGPVKVFAEALLDDDPVYRRGRRAGAAHVPVRDAVLGFAREGGAAGLPIEKLRGPGRAILHGEQEFDLHPRCRTSATCSRAPRRSPTCTRRNAPTAGKLEFYVTETDWRDADTGEPVVKTMFTLAINVRPPKQD